MDKQPRTCTECGAGMSAGYCIDDGGGYFCSDACLYSDDYTPAQYARDYADGFAYWTEWGPHD